jgi:2-polyprenyl-3-methyl-5-hydroxy-6-metoxy-1,4-benzoquinol methylase
MVSQVDTAPSEVQRLPQKTLNRGRFELPRRAADRAAFIVGLCRERRVLHLGCADSPLTTERIRHNDLLHTRITEVAKECLGIDADGEAIAEMRRFGIQNVRTGDAEHLQDMAAGTFDVVVAGEIIEHLSNPGLFLSGVHSVLESGGHLVITTANAFCLRRLVRIPFGVESVHPDHVSYYSHATLGTLVRRFGFEPTHRLGYSLPKTSPTLPYWFDRMAGWISPNLCEGIIHVYQRRSRAHSRNPPIGDYHRDVATTSA